MTAIDMPVLQLGHWLLHPEQARTYLKWAGGAGLVSCGCSIQLGDGGCGPTTMLRPQPAVQVGTTPTLLFSSNSRAGSWIVQNRGTTPIVLSDASGVVGPQLDPLGEVRLDNVDGELWAVSPAGAQVAGLDTRILATADAMWSDPVTDIAPWVDAAYPESARFLGVFVTAIHGLDDPVVSRSMTNRVGGGGVAGATTIGPRGLRIEGLLLAADSAGLAWGKRWWSRRWDRVSDWSAVLGCSGAQLSVHGHCDQPWLDLFEVVAPSGPEWAETQCCGTVVAFSLDLSAGSPWLWEQPVVVTEGTLGDGGAATCGCGAVILGGGFDAPFTECPACAPCDAPAADCLVDPAVPVVAEPTWVAGATEFDPQGRPNCGPGSAFYLSGVETTWTDGDGRASTNGHYLDQAQEAPVTDHFGAPSCGSGSAIYGAYPASASQTVTLYASTETAPLWEAQQVVVSALTPTQLAHLATTITPAGGATVRNVTRQTLWRNQNAAAPVLAGSALVQVRTAPSTTAVVCDGGIAIPPVGWVADVVVSWEQLVPTGTVTVTATTEATGPIASSNGGSFPAYDAAGRPSCGPGSEHYGDELPIRDPQGRPSCGPGSAFYGLETAVFDAAGRPSCGTGSAHYADQVVVLDWDGRPSCGAGSAQWLQIPAAVPFDQPLGSAGAPEGVYDGSSAFPARITAAAWNQGRFSVTATNAGVALHRITVTYWSKTGRRDLTLFDSGCRYPQCGGGFTTGDRALPQLPPDAVLVTNVAVEWQTTYGTGGGTAAITMPFPGADEVASPNAGADVTCAIGPNNGVDRACNQAANGGVDRACTVGPNAGAIGQCGGTDRPCAPLVLGPNGGTTRVLATECVTTSKLVWTEFVGGWDIPVPVDGALPHPGDTTSMQALLEAAEGASVPGLTTPLGAYLFRLRKLPVSSTTGATTNATVTALGALLKMPSAARILAARLVLKFTPPTGSQTSTTWPGWTLQARSGGTVRGGWKDTTLEPTPDDDGYVRVALDIRTVTDLTNVVLYGQLAAPTGGEPGRLDYAAVEVQWVATGGKRVCGPNGGVDVPCPSTTATAAVPGWVAPREPIVRCETITPPTNADAVSVLTFTAPAGRDLRSIEVRWYANPTGLPCPSASPSAAASWACTTPLATALIPRVPAGTTLTISGNGERVTVTCDGVERDATGLIFAPSGPFRWPVLTGRTCVCITADACAGATTAARYSTGYSVRHAR